MAKFTSHVYSEIRGSVSGTTYSRNRFGQYTRRRAVPAQPRTPFQQSVREFFASLSGGWRDLSEDNMAGWRSIAERIVRTDSLGQRIRLTGLQAYILLNMVRRALGLARQLEPPPDIGTPPAIATLTLSLNLNVAPPEFHVIFTPSPLQGAIIIEATAPQSAGVNSVPRSKYRYIKTVKPGSFGASITSPQNIYNEYTARFGEIPLGGKVFVRVIPVSYDTADTAGFAGTPISASIVRVD